MYYSKQQFFFNYFKMLFVVLCIVQFQGHAQTQKKSYQEFINLYKTTIQKNPVEAKQYAEAANRIASQSNIQENIGWSLYYLADCNANLMEFNAVFKYLQQATQIAIDTEDVLLALKCYNLQGNILSDAGNEIDALKSYLQARTYAKKTNDPLHEIMIAINIAYIKKIHKNYDEAIAILKENLAELNTLSTLDERKNRYKLSVLMNLCDAYLRLSKLGDKTYLNDAKYYNDLGLTQSTKSENAVYYYVLLMNKVILKYEKEHYNESLSLVEEVIDFCSETNMESTLCTAYFYLGKNYYKLQKYDEAISFLEKASAIITDSEKKYSITKELHEILSECYHNIQNTECGLWHQREFSRLEKETSSESIRINNKIHKAFDLLPFEETINELDDALKIQKQRKWVLYLCLIVLAALFIISVVFYRRKVKSVRQKFEAVLKKVAALEKENNKEKGAKSISAKVTDKKAQAILEKLATFEENESYLSQECSLNYVAELLQVNTSYLSNVINNYKKKSFRSYVTELRINKALVALKNDKRLRSYTIQAIAEEFGFKRQETFSKAFKAQTGLYPSAYVKKLSK